MILTALYLSLLESNLRNSEELVTEEIPGACYQERNKCKDLQSNLSILEQMMMIKSVEESFITGCWLAEILLTNSKYGVPDK